MSQTTPQKVYKNLQKAAARVEAHHYASNPQARARHVKGKLVKPYTPSEEGVELCKASGQVLRGEITPAEGMGLLHYGETGYKLKQARAAGY